MTNSSKLQPWQRNLVIALFAIGIVTRLWNLGEKAFHHDESIHAFYSWKVATEGRSPDGGKTATFGYDPVYHGPFLYHFGALFFFLFGDNDFTARLPYATFGILLLWLVWEARKLVGVPMAMGMLGAVVLSPIVNYYSRFARNDVYIGTAFFAVALYAALFLKERKSHHLILASFFLVLGYSIKENSYIYGFALGVFLVGYGLIRLLLRKREELRVWLGPAYPLVILTLLYASFSFFVFTFVAVDYWVAPERGLVAGLFDIASNAFEGEKKELSGPELRKKMEEQTRFFTDEDRSGAKAFYFFFAVFLTLLVLIGAEFLRNRLRSRPTEEEPRPTPVVEKESASGIAESWPLFVLAPLLVIGLGLLWAKSLIPFLFAVILWIAFETLRREFLDQSAPGGHRRDLPNILSPWLLVASCLFVISMVYLFLFSQMFGDLKDSERFAGRNGLERGIYDYVQYWFGHQLGEYRLWGPWWYYIARLLVYEYAFLTVSFFGLLIAGVWVAVRNIKRQSDDSKAKLEIGPFVPFFLFTLWLAVFNTLIYAKLHEKAPWLAFHQALPWALVAGGLLGWGISTFRQQWFRVLVSVLVVPLALLTLKAHLQVNHIHADNTAELVSQQQADRDIRDTVEMVYRLAEETGLYENFPIASEDEVEWPFPWYFRNYDKYRVKTADPNAFVQFGDDSTFREMRSKLGDDFYYRKYLHRGAWIENEMGTRDLPGGESLWKNIVAYLKDEKFQGKSFRLQFWNYLFHREIWSDINPKWGYVYIKKEMLPTLEPIDVPKGTLDPPRPINAETQLAGPAQSTQRFRLPRGLTLAPDGNIHVVDSLNGRVLVLDPQGKLVRAYGAPGTGQGQLQVDGTWGPSAVAVDAEGNCYVADTWNHRVVKFDYAGNPLASWGSNSGAAATKFFGPRGIALGPDGLVYVADTGEGEIHVFEKDGKPVRTFGKKGIRAGEFDEPVGLAFSKSGDLYVCDVGNERIQILTPAGGAKGSWMVPGWSFDKVGMEPAIDFLSDGRVILTLSRKNMLRVYEADGKSAVNYTLGSNSQPLGVAVLPTGEVWISDRSTNQIVILSSLAN